MAKKILLADDSLTIQKVVELTFSDSEFDLVCVSNGQKALERVREDRPDLILADVVMPEKNGYEVCEAIKSNPATARIPVVLLSGTFEPFDRERAERIGCDAIVSKPFDSQQLLAQVEELLGRAGAQAPTQPMPAAPASGPPPLAGGEPEPFDTGFSAEDFTAAVRMPPKREAVDPFEEEYGRGDVDSAIAAFEKEHPEFVPGAEQSGAGADVAEKQLERAPADPSREPLAQWLREEPEKAMPSPGLAVSTGAGAAGIWEPKESETTGPIEYDAEKTVAIRVPDERASVPADETPTLEIPQETVAMKLPEESEPEPPAQRQAPAGAAREISATEAQALFEVEKRATEQAAATAEVPREIEIMAQTASIPELTQMLSSVVKPGEVLSEEQMERLAARVVEKLSDRIVREIAWEVIPDMAEIVIKQRIKELEAGLE